MRKVPFRVSARTARLIGRENVANAGGAIIELVKNCYDADAQNCIVFFDNKYCEIPPELDHENYRLFCEETKDDNLIRNCYERKKLYEYRLSSEISKEQFSSLSSYFSGKCSLYIIDNGDGMDDSVIISKWMMIGTDNKEQEFEADSGRIRTGAKGIGRFALDRLGNVSEIYTLPKEDAKGYLWKIDWKAFEKHGVAISDIKADLAEIEPLNLKDKILSLTNNHKPLAKLLDKIELSNGTLIKISMLRDEWDDDNVGKIFENLELLVPPKEMPIFQIDLLSSFRKDKYGTIESPVCDDFDYKITAKHTEDKKVLITVERNELNFDLIKTKYKDVFLMKDMQKFPYDYETFKKGQFQLEMSLYHLLPGFKDIDTKGISDQIGEFSFVFYFLKNTISAKDRIVYPYNSISSATRRAWLKKFGGVKIFRDNFRVRPYGEDGNDWLGLGERQAESPGGAGQIKGGYRIRPNQISGSIHISRITNKGFQDKAGREGIQENDAFHLFRLIITGLIKIFEKDRNITMFSFNQLHKLRNHEEEAKRKAIKIAFERSENREKLSNDDEADILSEGIRAQQREIEKKEDELRLMRSLASIGLIVSSFAHELKTLRARILPRTNDLKDILEELINPEQTETLPEEDDPFLLIQDMRNQDERLKHWLDYSLSSLKRDKRERSNVDFHAYFSNFKRTWKKALENRKVALYLSGESDSCIIRAFEIDLDTVFNNLLVNSLDAFKRKTKSPFKREIHIFWKKLKKSVEIMYEDAGPGISKDFDNPENIVLPFETSKRDKKGDIIGTGMGMYLLKIILDEYNSEVDISDSETGFKLRILFPLREQGGK